MVALVDKKGQPVVSDPPKMTKGQKKKLRLRKKEAQASALSASLETQPVSASSPLLPAARVSPTSAPAIVAENPSESLSRLD
jgi:hypothetical protein